MVFLMTDGIRGVITGYSIVLCTQFPGNFSLIEICTGCKEVDPLTTVNNLILIYIRLFYHRRKRKKFGVRKNF